jgi:hypothetical protein
MNECEYCGRDVTVYGLPLEMCGPNENDSTCLCCGMTIIAQANTEETQTEE